MTASRDEATGNELGTFLRAQRARVTPDEVGLNSVGTRRVEGLRREEVAVLAGVSVDYYSRLEQGRERGPSAQVLDAVCRALLLGPDARDHAFRLARLTPSARVTTEEPSAHLRGLLDSFPKAAAYVVNPAFRVIAANDIATGLIAPAHHDGQVMQFMFLDPSATDYFIDWDDVARSAVSAIRLAAGYTPQHREVAALIRRLHAHSAAFTTLWNDSAVQGLTTVRKRIRHPAVGTLELWYQTFDVREAPGLQLTVATAEPGSSSEDALALLGSITATGRARAVARERPEPGRNLRSDRTP